MNTAQDVWGKLWDIATDDTGEPARIIPDGNEPGVVTLEWPSGERTTLTWDNGDWQFPEALSARAE